MANDLPREDWDNYAARVDPDGVGPRLFFQRVPEPKTAKNRVHLDLDVSGGRGTPHGGPPTPRSRTRSSGPWPPARPGCKDYDEAGQHWVVLQDPEGNEFCLH